MLTLKIAHSDGLSIFESKTLEVIDDIQIDELNAYIKTLDLEAANIFNAKSVTHGDAKVVIIHCEGTNILYPGDACMIFSGGGTLIHKIELPIDVDVK